MNNRSVRSLAKLAVLLALPIVAIAQATQQACNSRHRRPARPRLSGPDQR